MGKQGFTLVELLIVMSVIAALVSIITPVAMNAIVKAKATQVAMNLRNLKSVVEQCIVVEESTGTTCTTIDGLVKSFYLSADPGDDYKIGEKRSDGYVSVWIGYKGDTDPKRVFQIYSEVVTGDNCKPHFNNDSSYRICVEAKVGKYW